jgi:preprotein translocase subunit SecY
LRRWTAGLTLALAVMQAIGVAGALERVPGLVIEPGLAFRLTAALTLTAGTMFLVWLSSQITARGVGNGFALILFAGIVADLPAIAAGILELGRMGAVSGTAILGLGALGIVLTGFVVFVELGVRRFAVNYRSLHLMLGSRERQGYLAFKINPAGVLIPSTLASWLLLLPVLLTTLSDAEPTSPWRALASQLTAPGAPLHLVFYGLAVIVCALFYGAFLLDADAMADDLAKRGAVLCEAELGEKPAEHLDAVLSRTTLLGATYLALMLLIPELLTAYGQVPFPVGGASLLIVVCAMLDLTAQLRWTPPPRLMGGLEDALGGERR